MKTILALALALTFTTSANAEIDSNNFWGTAADTADYDDASLVGNSGPQVDTEVQPDSSNASLLIKSYPYGQPALIEDYNETGYLRLVFPTSLIITSKSDELNITGVTVNRGNCKAYIPVPGTTVKGKNGPVVTTLYKEVTPTNPVKLSFSEKYTFWTRCKASDIIEVTTSTPFDTLTWQFN